MLDIQRWNYQTKQYDPYTPPAEWVLVIYSEDMDLTINCANCGTPMPFGRGYTSRELHTHVGFGYPVCATCYTAECKRDTDNRKKEAAKNDAKTSA